MYHSASFWAKPNTRRSAKTMMQWTDASERSLKNWLSGYVLMRLFVESAAVRALLLELILDPSSVPSALAVEAGIGPGPTISRPQRSKRALIMVTSMSP